MTNEPMNLKIVYRRLKEELMRIENELVIIKEAKELLQRVSKGIKIYLSIGKLMFEVSKEEAMNRLMKEEEILHLTRNKLLRELREIEAKLKEL